MIFAIFKASLEFWLLPLRLPSNFNKLFLGLKEFLWSAGVAIFLLIDKIICMFWKHDMKEYEWLQLWLHAKLFLFCIKFHVLQNNVVESYSYWTKTFSFITINDYNAFKKILFWSKYCIDASDSSSDHSHINTVTQ